jgi:hypothetical protein
MSEGSKAVRLSYSEFHCSHDSPRNSISQIRAGIREFGYGSLVQSGRCSCLSFAASHEHMNNQSARISRRPAIPADLDLFRHVEENGRESRFADAL